MRIPVHSILLIASVFAGFPMSKANAQDLPLVTATIERDTVQIADPFWVIFEVTAPADAQVHVPQMSKAIGPFEILDQKELFGIPSVSSPDEKTWSLQLYLETLETGQLQIPAIEVVVEQTSGERKRIQSAPISVTVESSIETGSDPTAFHDIRDLIDAPQPNEEETSNLTWTLIGVLTGFGVAAGAAIFALMRRKNPMTPAAWARLQLTDRTELTLSDVETTFREFLTDEFHQNASSWSSDEMEEFSSDMQLSIEQTSLLSEFLAKAQQEKFAGLRVSENEIDANANLICELIDHLQRQNREAT